VITAVAMAKDLAVMLAAVTISVLVMLLAAGTISRFVDRHPTIIDARAGFPDFDRRSPGGGWARSAHRKGYIYFAMAFSTIVEMLNIRVRSRQRK
jgi:predicted tellurium resistance membrane protein TerC